MRKYIPTVKEMDHLDIVCETQLKKNTNLGKIKNRNLTGVTEFLFHTKQSPLVRTYLIW